MGIYIAFAVVCTALPLAAFLAFRAGYNTALAIYRGERIRAVAPKVLLQKSKESREETRARIIHDNIEAYGTKAMQKDVI